MGLDMYLYRKSFVNSGDYVKPELREEVVVTKNGQPHPIIKSDRVVYVVERVGQWRKFNALHKWFVENVQGGEDDCREYEVRYEQLEELHDLLQQMKANKGDTEFAQSQLPTQSGFFFGSTDYDQFYWGDIDMSIEILGECLREKENYSEYYYRSSW
jgi:hypothetical protein